MITAETILAAAARDASVASYLRAALQSDLVLPNPHHRQIARFVLSFVDEYRRPPMPGDVDLWIQSLGEQARPGVRDAWHRIAITSVEGYTLQYFAETALTELRFVAAQTARARLNVISEVTPEVLESLSKEVQSVQPINLSNLVDLKDVSRWMTTGDEIERRVTTGIHSLDRMIGGGFEEELVFVMADSAMGKSMLLVNFAVAAALHGERVLYITLENSAENTAHRCYRRISMSDRPSFKHSQTEVSGKVLQWMQFARGSVHILYLESYKYEPSEIQGIIDAFSSIHGTPSFIALDYLDLMAPPRDLARGNSYEQLGKMSHLVRNWAGIYSAPVVSATQATRGAASRSRLRMEDMGDSYGKIRAAGLVLGLGQTEEEAELHQGRITIVKARESGGMGEETPIYINRDLVLMADLSHPNTQKIMRELGHHPIPEVAA